MDLSKSTENAVEIILRPTEGDFDDKWTCSKILKWDITKININCHVLCRQIEKYDMSHVVISEKKMFSRWLNGLQPAS